MIKVNAHILNYLSSYANINVIATLEDNFGNSFELEFDFNNRNIKDDGFTIVPIGNFKPLQK